MTPGGNFGLLEKRLDMMRARKIEKLQKAVELRKEDLLDATGSTED